MAVGLVVAGLAVLLTLILWLFQSLKTKRVIDKIPGPPALPLLGNAHQFEVGGSGRKNFGVSGVLSLPSQSQPLCQL